MMKLLASEIINPAIEGHYAFYTLVSQLATQAHNHNFFGIFLLLKGSIYHHVNNQAHWLSSGALVFIRPQDTHYYQADVNQNCELINLAFLQSTYDALGQYLESELYEGLLYADDPPMVMLAAAEKAAIRQQLQQWKHQRYQNEARARLSLRAMLAHILVKEFITGSASYTTDTPRWLIDVCEQMRHKDRIIEGRPALIRLAGRTPEHLGRVFKASLGITPSQFVNGLRLDYASELLLHTDQRVAEICFATGFENLSHFYHLFKARWGCSPQQFRDLYRRTLIP